MRSKRAPLAAGLAIALLAALVLTVTHHELRPLIPAQRAPLIRINPREPDVAPGRGIGVPLGALDALLTLRACLD